MRIALVIEHFDRHRGGAEQYTWQLAQRLLARAHEVHVLAQDFAPAGEPLPIVAHELGCTGSRLGFAAAAERALRGLPMDVIHDMGSGWYGELLQPHDGSRIAQWQQKLALLPPWARPIKRGMIRLLPRYRAFRQLMARQFADPRRTVLALSRMCAEDYRRYHGVPAERIRVVYNGVDPQRFTPAARPEYRSAVRLSLDVQEDEVLWLFVGHDFRRKGLETALRALARLRGEGHAARLAVLGGKRGSAAGRWAQRCGVAHAVSFVGATRDPVPYYAAADVLVLPTCYDPCSLSVLEAAASGLPSVTTMFNGAGELLSDGLDGYVLTDPADDLQLAERLRRLMIASLRRQMGQAARQLALQHTLDHNCDQIVAIYRHIAGRQRCAA